MLVVALGLIVAAIVLMFRPEANSYFTADSEPARRDRLVTRL